MMKEEAFDPNKDHLEQSMMKMFDNSSGGGELPNGFKKVELTSFEKKAWQKGDDDKVTSAVKKYVSRPQFATNPSLATNATEK